MDGPSHFREAEGFLESAAYWKAEADHAAAEYALRAAQVHTTLATAAAAALWPAGAPGVSLASMSELTAWFEVCAANPDEVKR